MKRTVLSIIAMLVLVAVPASAMAKHGSHHGKSGTIKSYDATSGDLTITTNKGRDITAAVTSDTRIQCDNSNSVATTSSHGGGDDNSGQGHHGKDDGANHDANDDNGDDNGDDPANHDAGDDNGGDGANHDANDDNGDDNGIHQANGGTCDSTKLTAGATVRRARIDLDGDDAVWTKLKLVG